jgi:hypothetical protein
MMEYVLGPPRHGLLGATTGRLLGRKVGTQVLTHGKVPRLEIGPSQ